MHKCNTCGFPGEEHMCEVMVMKDWFEAAKKELDPEHRKTLDEAQEKYKEKLDISMLQQTVDDLVERVQILEETLNKIVKE